MQAFQKRIFWFISILVFMLGGLYFSGAWLDSRSEKFWSNLYSRNSEGVIIGAESKEFISNHKNALVLISGFLETPPVFENVYSKAKALNKFDVYIPLLPFNGRDLKTASQFSNQRNLQFLADYFRKLGHKYDKLVILGFSYGGALVADLVKDNQVPMQSLIILYSPAIHIKNNTFFTRFFTQIYGLWRDYCDFDFLGCYFPVYESGDEQARGYLEIEISPHSRVVPALNQLYAQDLKARKYFPWLGRPYHVIIAEDDNRIDLPKFLLDVSKNDQNTLHMFPSGAHLLHKGVNKEPFFNLLLRISLDYFQSKKTSSENSPRNDHVPQN